MKAMGAQSPRRSRVRSTRVYPPTRTAYRAASSPNTFSSASRVRSTAAACRRAARVPSLPSVTILIEREKWEHV